MASVLLLVAPEMACVTAGCAARPSGAAPAFRFPADTFAFANETVWEYVIDDASGRTAWRERRPRPSFALRCGAMARAVRQLRLHARFDPSPPPPSDATLAILLADVFARDPRARAPSPAPVVVPGWPDLRAASAARPAVFQRALGGSWRSYFQRGNWRMIFPFPPGRQRDEAERLAASIRRGTLPIVHVLRFPALTLNHLVVAYAVDETPDEIRFTAYDPNDAAAPITLRWDRGARTFVYPRTIYFGGGPVRAYEVYTDLLF